MATKTIFRSVRPRPIFHSFQAHAQRSFLTLPGTEVTKLKETRILPYSSPSLYAIIANVDSYSNFLPYCIESRVTKWSYADKDGKKWPSEADLKVGWGGYEETFTSKLFCIPGTVVEALGGKAKTSLSKADLAHHAETIDSENTTNSIFESLSTKWTLKPFYDKSSSDVFRQDTPEHPARDQTEVNLVIEFQFSNPIYGALSKAVIPKVADVMIEAFETRARQLLDGSTIGGTELKTSGEISSHKIEM